MEITSDQKSLLQQVDTDIEDSFSAGVTQSGAYLPALQMYDRIPVPSRVLGRQGILSTFAAFLSRLASFSPTATALVLLNGFAPWGDARFASPQFHKNALGEVVLEGLIRCIAAPGVTLPIFQLPVGARPAKYSVFVVGKSGVPVLVRISDDGFLYCEVETVNGDWLSLDGIRFRPG